MLAVSNGKEALLTCYCPVCSAEFKRQTGADPPVAAKVNWTSHVVDDNDLWLKWNTFRANDCFADYTRCLADVLRQHAPEVKIGYETIKTVDPEAGIYSYYSMQPCGAVSSYVYPRNFERPAIDYFMRATGLMGNREKESWMLNWIGGNGDLKVNGQAVAPPGEVRTQFWNMLGAGNRQLSYFIYGDPGSKWCIEGTPAMEELAKVGAVAKTVGPLFAVARPAPSQVAVLCAFSDFCGRMLPHTDGWWGAYNSLKHTFFGVLDANVSPDVIAEEELIAGQTAGYKVIVVPQLYYLRKSASTRCKNSRPPGERC